MSTTRSWIIRGYNGLEVDYERRIKTGCLSDKQARTLIQRLSCRYLTPDEIVESSIKKSCLGFRPLLVVAGLYGPALVYSVGENPYFTASMEEN